MSTDVTKPAQAVAKGKMATVQDTLQKYKSQIHAALPSHIKPEVMIRVITTTIAKNPALLECDQKSFFAAVLTSSQLGLMPDGITGEAYFIPYKNNSKGITECQFIPGYRGLISLAMRSGQISRFQARAVYEGDEFDYEFGLNERLEHKPKSATSKMTHVYAVLAYKDGSKVFEVMTRKEVEFLRDKAGKDKSAVWRDYFEEMAKKTVIRKLGKIAPISPEFQKAVALSEDAEILGKSQKLDIDMMGGDDADLNATAMESFAQDAEIVEEQKAEAKKESVKAGAQEALEAAAGKVGITGATGTGGAGSTTLFDEPKKPKTE